MKTRLSSATKEVIIGDEQPTVLIGERINPAGKRKLSEALKAGNLEIVSQEAKAQVLAGADIIDVNVTMLGVDDVILLPQVVQAVMNTVDVPLSLASTNYKALEAALNIYKGKPLINSVTGEEQSLKNIFPLVKEYGAAVIALVQDDDGIPHNSERRLAIANKILDRAEAIGIPHEDIIIDCLVSAVGADMKSGLVVIEAIHRIKTVLGVNLILGLSNVSFGLPERELFNNEFAAIAIAAGVNCLIVDVAKARLAVLATDLILGRDKYARRYIEFYRNCQ